MMQPHKCMELKCPSRSSNTDREADSGRAMPRRSRGDRVTEEVLLPLASEASALIHRELMGNLGDGRSDSIRTTILAHQEGISNKGCETCPGTRNH